MAAAVPFLLILAAAPLLAAAERARLVRRPIRALAFGAPALAIMWIALCVMLLGLTP